MRRAQNALHVRQVPPADGAHRARAPFFAFCLLPPLLTLPAVPPAVFTLLTAGALAPRIGWTTSALECARGAAERDGESMGMGGIRHPTLSIDAPLGQPFLSPARNLERVRAHVARRPERAPEARAAAAGREVHAVRAAVRVPVVRLHAGRRTDARDARGGDARAEGVSAGVHAHAAHGPIARGRRRGGGRAGACEGQGRGRRYRVASLLSVKPPEGEETRRGIPFMRPHTGCGRAGRADRGGSGRTMHNADDLHSYEAAVLARKAPELVPRKPARRQTTSAGPAPPSRPPAGEEAEDGGGKRRA
ncbi:hypothetical protein FB451DRAFT_1185500 [Mycena latifolia]|nr:hypothetical protein FB451DRAFT_1185500 [Mycena latifolia]